MTSQGTMDKDVNENIKRIMELNPVGKCALHKDLRCYHDRLSDMHFELTEQKVRIWAVKIVCPTRFHSQHLCS
jgi:hypothetical protein